MKFDYLAPWRFRSGLRRLKRFIAWFPVIWRDEEWDAAYLYEIMRFKISRMRADMEKAQRHTTWKRDVKNMRVAEFVLNRLAFSDHYHDNYEKHRDERCTCKGHDLLSCLVTNSEGRTQWKSPYCRYCEILLKRVYDKQEKAELAFVFDLMKKQTPRWWN